MRDRRHDARGRSTGRPTAAGGKFGKIDGQFAPRTIEMLRSPAMAALSLTGRRILDRLEIELADHGGSENGSLPVTYDDFERFGIHRHQIKAGLAEVVVLGFVEITRQGRAGNAQYRLPTLYRLTYRHTATGNPTNEWEHIANVEEAEAIAKTSRTRAHKHRRKKISSGGQRHVSVAVTDTKSGHSHSAETATTGLSAETTTTFDISGRGKHEDDYGDTVHQNIPGAKSAIASAIMAEISDDPIETRDRAASSGRAAIH